MRKSVLLASLASLLCLAACKKSDSGGDGTSPPKANGDAADALWAQAPDKLVGGFVATGGALANVDPIIDELRNLSKDPELALVAQAVGQLDAVLGKPDQHTADVGIDPSKGFAVFMTEDKVQIAILPMGDRDKLVKTLHGSRGAKDGDPDTIRELSCNMIKDAYVCAQDLKAVADRLGKGLGAKVLGAKLAATGARGDVEWYFSAALLKGTGFTDMAATAALGHGAIDARVFIAGKPTIPALAALATAPRTKPELANPGGFIAGDLAPILAAVAKDLPNIPLPGGNKPSDLVATIKGPFTARMAAGLADFNVRIPLTDPAPFTKLIENCSMLGLFLTLADKQEPGSCALAVKAGYPTIVAWVENGELRLSTKKGAITPGPTDLMTPAAKDLATGEWNYAAWGRGSVFAANRITLPPMPNDMPAETTLALRGVAALSELGAGVKVDQDGVRARVYLRTIWSNPNEVARKLAAIPSTKVLDGSAVATVKAIADGAPTAPIASDLAAGQSGLMAPLAVIGAVAGVAIPAYMDYQKGPPRRSLAQLELNDLGKHLKVYFVEHSEFPKGTVAPGATCCGQDANACHDKFEDPTWKAIEFAPPADHQMYRFGYTSTDGKSFTAVAVGDLDCDGTEVTWTLNGSVDGTGNPAITIVAPTNPD